jgi:hypothetical protein
MKKIINGDLSLMKMREEQSQNDERIEVSGLTKAFFCYIISTELSLLKTQRCIMNAERSL